MKNYLSKSILFLGLLSLTTNCTKDNEVIDIPTQQENGIIIKQLNFKELSLETKVIEKIQKIKQLKKTNLAGKSSKYIAEYDFYIDLKNAKTVETANYKTYNFLIQRDNPTDDKLENLFLRLNQEGEYDAYILKYDFSAEELEHLNTEDLNNRITEYTPIDIELTIEDTNNISSKYICGEVWEYKSCTMSGNHGDGSECIPGWVLVSSECINYYAGAGISTGSTGSNTTESNGPSGGTSGTTSGTSTSINTNNNYVYSTPVTKSAGEIAIDNFFENSLTNEQKSYLSTQLSLKKQIQIDLEKSIDPRDVEGGDLLFKKFTFYKGQIELETKIWYTNKDNKWIPQNGKLKGRDDLKYTKVYHTTTESHYLMEDGSYVIGSGTELTLNSDGVLARKATSELFPNEKYWYLKHPDVGEWANFLFSENNLADEVEKLLIMGSKEFAKSIGRYALPVEEFKVLFTGTDFDGNQVNQYLNAGILVVGFIPGSKALKAVKFIPTSAIKWGKVVNKVNGGSTTLKYEIINNIVDFGTQSSNNYKLRQILGLITGDGKHAHHIIPFDFRTSDLVQKAAKANKRFHISEKINGISLPSTNHLTGHPNYSLKVNEILTRLNQNIGSNNNLAYEELSNFIGYLDNLIRNNSNKNLGEIADLINY